MLLIVIRVIYAVVCAGAVFVIVQPQKLYLEGLPELVNDATSDVQNVGSSLEPTRSAPVRFRELSPARKLIEKNPAVSFVLMLLASQVITFLDLIFPRKRIDIISAVYFGLLVGWLLSYLLYYALKAFLLSANLDPNWADIGLVMLGVMMPYICISFLLQTRNDFRFIIPYVEFAKEIKGSRPLVVDTSSLIDGRIADFMDTNVLDNQLLIPSFVLEELQSIADSNDKMRRVRGRRGLDVLTKLQQNAKVDVRLYDVPDKEFSEMTVDQRLVALAKRMGGRVVTNDFNLNKVAGVHGVDVINLNDVSNSLKPRYLPGEQLRMRVIRDGESAGQGVGYLDDGTMVVCEQASVLIGKDIDVIVTSMLQNSSGRMIFGRMPGSAIPAQR
jgi:uncharacterized protein YacL